MKRPYPQELIFIIFNLLKSEDFENNRRLEIDIQ